MELVAIVLVPVVGLGLAVLLMQLVTSDWLASSHALVPALKAGRIIFGIIGAGFLVLAIATGAIVLIAPFLLCGFLWMRSALFVERTDGEFSRDIAIQPTELPRPEERRARWWGGWGNWGP